MSYPNRKVDREPLLSPKKIPWLAMIGPYAENQLLLGHAQHETYIRCDMATIRIKRTSRPKHEKRLAQAIDALTHNLQKGLELAITHSGDHELDEGKIRKYTMFVPFDQNKNELEIAGFTEKSALEPDNLRLEEKVNSGQAKPQRRILIPSLHFSSGYLSNGSQAIISLTSGGDYRISATHGDPKRFRLHIKRASNQEDPFIPQNRLHLGLPEALISSDDEHKNPLIIKAYGRSVMGTREGKKVNEDCISTENDLTKEEQKLTGERGRLYILADGMGGQNRGDNASQLTVKTTRETYYHTAEPSAESRLEKAIQQSHKDVYALGTGVSKPGSTIAAMLIMDNRAILAHVGDTRHYILRDGALYLLTADDTYAFYLATIDDAASLEDVSNDQRRNTLGQAIGTNVPLPPQFDKKGFQPVNTHMQQLLLRKGDKLLSLVDGLWGALPHETIRKIVLVAESPQEAIDNLIAAAKATGEQDDTSGIAVFVDDDRDLTAGH